MSKQPKRFWSKVEVGEVDECWEWTACKVGGYGQFGINYKVYYAHRISWFLTHGPIPKGMLVCHHCDNPSCVNPSHLFLGTDADNHMDAAKKGLRAQKLSSEDVLEIRELLKEGSLTLRDIADEYGVDRKTIFQIKKGEIWKWCRVVL